MLHAYSTNKTLSNGTKVNDIVTFTVTSILKIAIFECVASGGIHISQTHLVKLFMERKELWKHQ